MSAYAVKSMPLCLIFNILKMLTMFIYHTWMIVQFEQFYNIASYKLFEKVFQPLFRTRSLISLAVVPIAWLQFHVLYSCNKEFVICLLIYYQLIHLLPTGACYNTEVIVSLKWSYCYLADDSVVFVTVSWNLHFQPIKSKGFHLPRPLQYSVVCPLMDWVLTNWN